MPAQRGQDGSNGVIRRREFLPPDRGLSGREGILVVKNDGACGKRVNHLARHRRPGIRLAGGKAVETAPAVEQARAILAAGLAPALKRTDAPAYGVFPVYSPVELYRAAGLFPIGLMGAGGGSFIRLICLSVCQPFYR